MFSRFRSPGNDVPVLHRHRHSVLVRAGRFPEVRAVLRRVCGLGAVALHRHPVRTRVAVLSVAKKPPGPGGRLVTDPPRFG